MSMPHVDYNDESYDYKEYWEGRDYENQSEFIALRKLLPTDFDEKRSVIDIGGGFGRLLPVLKDSFGDVTIFDYSQKLLDDANLTGEKLGLKIKTIKGDIFSISQSVGRKYDCAVMVRVSHHLDDLEKVFLEVSKILEPGGIFILEVANKIHFKAVITNLFKRNFSYFDKDPVSVATKDVTFLNHHPMYVEKLLTDSGFKIEKMLSVSNLRSPLLKKFIPLKLLLIKEKFLQDILTPFYFGPSIFYKLKKE